VTQLDLARDYEPTQDIHRERTEIFVRAKRQLAKTLSRESWLLPEPVRAITDQLESELGTRYDRWFEHLDSREAAAKQASVKIEEVAKDELKRPPFWRL